MNGQHSTGKVASFEFQCRIDERECASAHDPFALVVLAPTCGRVFLHSRREVTIPSRGRIQYRIRLWLLRDSISRFLARGSLRADRSCEHRHQYHVFIPHSQTVCLSRTRKLATRLPALLRRIRRALRSWASGICVVYRDFALERVRNSGAHHGRKHRHQLRGSQALFLSETT